MQYIPRSLTVTQSELKGKTTIEAQPNSAQAEIYRELARKIDAHTQSAVPSPLEPQELRDWADQWADLLVRIEAGEVPADASAI